MKRDTETAWRDNRPHTGSGRPPARFMMLVVALTGFTVWMRITPGTQAADAGSEAGQETLSTDETLDRQPSVPELIRELYRENARLRDKLREARDRHVRALRQRDEALDLLRIVMARRSEEKNEIERQREAAERFADIERRARQELQTLRDRLRSRESRINDLEMDLARLRRARAKAVIAPVPATQVAEVEDDDMRRKTPDRQQRRDEHYNRGVQLARDGRWLEAANEYLMALEVDPRDADTHYNLGVLYHHQLSRPARAMPHYQAYLRKKPYTPHAAAVRRWLRTIEAGSR